MKTINKATLLDIANKLMFDMNNEEYDTLMDEFDVILKQMQIISEIPGVDDLEPMTFPFDVKVTYLREDVASTPLDSKEALKNAKEVINGQIRVPKVVG